MNVGTNQFIEIKEFAKDYTELKRRSFRPGKCETGRRKVARFTSQKAGANRCQSARESMSLTQHQHASTLLYSFLLYSAAWFGLPIATPHSELF